MKLKFKVLLKLKIVNSYLKVHIPSQKCLFYIVKYAIIIRKKRSLFFKQFQHKIDFKNDKFGIVRWFAIETKIFHPLWKENEQMIST